MKVASYPKFNFNNLFVLDMANNHQGSIDHGLRIIDEHAEIVKKHNVRAGIKFQFRDLPNFVHPEERENSKNKHVPRFLSTKLSWDSYSELKAKVDDHGLLSICTPFDENSVEKIVELKFDIIKVASCSATDWPLLEKVANSGLPIIASTGGLTISQIDDLVSFFNHRACDFALMHCVSIYPTPDEACNLGNISSLIKRYPKVTIGWSTHEPPSETSHVGLSYALGSRMFERHIGVNTSEIQLNKYSSTPEECCLWYEAYHKAITIIGKSDRSNLLPEEKESLDSLKRGIFSKFDLKKNSLVKKEDVYFAFPYRKGQLSSSEFKEGMKISKDLKKNEALTSENCSYERGSDEVAEAVLKKAVHEVKALLNDAGITLSHEFTTEYSHHYGILNFREVGAVLITIVNREYAKKILVQLPGQRNPLHLHKLKEETFLVVKGDLTITLDGEEKQLCPGDQVTVPPGVWHSFGTQNGVVFEEISTTAHKEDSYYKDPNVSKLSSAQRKTKVDHWGRFQINEQLRKANITG